MKCGKVKNPCKICLQSVSNKNGLQCKGACKKWAHFKCLDYTPGKISDIKAGLISITCPCPDCSIPEQREIVTNPPHTCKNEECAATGSSLCEVPDCPKKQNPIPPFPTSEYLPRVPTCPEPTVPKGPTPPIKAPHVPSPKACPPSPLKTPCPATPPKVPCPACALKISSPCTPPRKASPLRYPTKPKATCSLCPTHCPKNSRLKLFIDKLISPQRSQSCSLTISSSSDSAMKLWCAGVTSLSFTTDEQTSHLIQSVKTCLGPSVSDSALFNVQDQNMLYTAVEQMCDTVGQLSNQLKGLMCNMRNTFQKNKQNRN